jgi:Putative peptidoglycan binding domain
MKTTKKQNVYYLLLTFGLLLLFGLGVAGVGVAHAEQNTGAGNPNLTGSGQGYGGNNGNPAYGSENNSNGSTNQSGSATTNGGSSVTPSAENSVSGSVSSQSPSSDNSNTTSGSGNNHTEPTNQSGSATTNGGSSVTPSAGNSGSGSGSGQGSGGGSSNSGGAPTDKGSGGKSGGGGGEETTTATNNLSFPTIAADGFVITPITSPSFSVVYSGPYVNLSAEELNALNGYDWYAQKTTGNVWQANFLSNPVGTPVNVFGIDWGDNVESVSPVTGKSYRLEITLYNKPATPMLGYKMSLLAYPSSINEAQGTNKETYTSSFATIVSSKPNLIIQYLGDTGSTQNVEWNGSAWTKDGNLLPMTNISFGPELNVGGKYVYGASKGGWTPVEAGVYRITVSLPGSDISLKNAIIGNIADWSTTTVSTEATETRASTPIIDAVNNISYVDVTVLSKRTGKSGSSGKSSGEVSLSNTSSLLTADALLSTTISPTNTSNTNSTSNTTECSPYLTDYMNPNINNDSSQVILLQKFLNDNINANIPLTGYFGQQTLKGVKDFQTANADKILQPWIDAGHTDVSLTEGTGNVGVTTLSTINSMKCGA